MKKLLFLAFVLISHSNVAQHPPYLNLGPSEILKRLQDYSTDKNYADGVKFIDSINPNDSLFLSLLTTKSYFLINEQRNEEAIEVTNLGLSMDAADYSHYYYLNKGVALVNLERFDEAHKNYDEGLKAHPGYARFYYNKGTAYLSAGDNSSAVEMFKKAIEIQPRHALSHYQLGKIAYHQHKWTQSLMCYLTYLMINPDGNDAFAVLKEANDFFSQKNEKQPDEKLILSKDENDFKSIDIILENRLALNADYPVPTEMNFALAKQAHVLIQLIGEFEGKDGFWTERYVPLFKWIAQNDQYNPFVYTISYSVQNDDYKKIVNSKVEEIKTFLGVFKTEWNSINSPAELLIDGKKVKTNYYFNDGYLYGIGLFENETPKGKWDFFEENGTKTTLGHFNQNGEREGLWEWRYINGQLKEKTQYTNGKLNGIYYTYHSNGKLSGQTNYVNDTLEGESKTFNKSGVLTERKFYKKGNLHGPYQGFYESGNIKRIEYQYVNGTIEGEVKEFYENGQIKFIVNFKEGKKDGIEKNYYPNGQLSHLYTYEAGELEGPYSEYYPDGQMYAQGNYHQGALNGLYEQFFADGAISFQYNYLDGQYHGSYKEFDSHGKIYTDMVFEKGKVISYQILDENGTPIASGKADNKGLNYLEYSRLRNPFLEGFYNPEGQKEGIWKTYYSNGALNAEQNFAKGMKNGSQKFYHANGKLLSEETYQNDTINGLDISYHKSGDVDYVSFYLNGLLQANTYKYYKDGSVELETYYHRGATNGKESQFAVDGKLKDENYYRDGDYIKTIFYKPDGSVKKIYSPYELKETEKVVFNYNNGQKKSEFSYKQQAKNGAASDYFINGKVQTEVNYLNGKLYGAYKAYHDNGQLKFTGNFLNDEWEGEVLYYHENGTKEEEHKAHNGKKYGWRKIYYESGVPEVFSYYLNGSIHGKRFNFSPDGELQVIRYYDYDVLLGYSYLSQTGDTLPMIPLPKESGKIEAYFANGNKSFEAEVKYGEYINDYNLYYASGQRYRYNQNVDGEYHGVFQLYYPDGTLQYEAQYLKGDLEGSVKKYYPNGKIKQIAQYKLGKAHGLTEKYDENGKLIEKITYYDDEATAYEKF